MRDRILGRIRSYLRKQAAWHLLGVVMALTVTGAVPVKTIRMIGSSMHGLIGSYNHPGYWQINVTYYGTATDTGQNVPGGQCEEFLQKGQWEPPTYHVDISTLTNTPPSNRADITGSFIAQNWAGVSTNGNETLLSATNAQMNFTLIWVPANDNMALDPPPDFVRIYYRRRLKVYGNVSVTQPPNTSGSGTVNATANCSGLTANSGQVSTSGDDADGTGFSNTNYNSDKQFQPLDLPVSQGVAYKTFTMSWSLDNKMIVVNGTPYLDVLTESSAEIDVDFCVSGFDMTRFGNGLQPWGGDSRGGASDPSFTRWLPLAFSPQVSSQPFRIAPGPLPAPWGNLNCMYSIALTTEPAAPNIDLDGYFLPYIPSAAVNGTFNNGPYTFLPPPLLAAYAITDCTGDRLVFDSGLHPHANVLSTLTQSGTTFTLSNAGPPGAMREAGHYIYTFQGGNGGVARLVSINDDCGNQQTLNWGAGNTLLTVSDSSSGRQLLFYGGSNGYLGSVDAPGFGLVNTHTTLAYDTNGHMTGVNVYDGVTNQLLHTDTFTYGGPNGDSVVATNNGGIQSSATFLTDSIYQDPFSLSTPRLLTKTYGSSGDSSSSDGGAVAGTYQYTYGPLSVGYGYFGVEARTNTVTDPRGNLFSQLFTLDGTYSGQVTQVQSTGPDFTGAPTSSNVSNTVYTPNMTFPTQTLVYDPLYFQHVTNSPWQTTFDKWGNTTGGTDPLDHTWQLGYSADGKNLTSATDPTNLTWTFNYGENGAPSSRLTSVQDPASATRGKITYNTFGQVSTLTLPAAVSPTGVDEQTAFIYGNAAGDLTAVTNPLGDMLTVNSYDPLGDPLSSSLFPDTGSPVTSTTPLTTSIVYDAAQDPVRVNAPTGTSLLTTFNNGIPLKFSVINQGATLAQMNLYVDTRGRLYAVSDAMGSAGQYRYDLNSNRTQVWDGRGDITRFKFGPNNEPIQLTWPDGAVASLGYDAGGRVKTATDERGIVSNFLEDAADRLTDIQFPAYPAQNVHISYDNAGRVLSVTDGSGSRTYNYDPVLKRLSSVVTLLAALPAGHNSFTVSYLYFPDGTLKSLTTPVGISSYGYDLAGHLQSVSDPFHNVTTWTHDHAGRITNEATQTAQNAFLNTAYTWGGSNQTGDPSTAPAYLSSIQQSVNGGQLWYYALVHSYLGQILSEQGGGGGSSHSQETFGYDSRGRLTSESESLQFVPQSKLTNSAAFTYDASNNVEAGSGWSYNYSNQVSSAPPLSGLAGMSGLGYDNAGDLTSAGANTLS